MDFFLTMSDGSRWLFPLNPEKVSLGIGPKMQTHETIALGDIQTPRGKQPDRIRWDGIFPGSGQANFSFVKSWVSPKTWIERLKKASEDGEKMRLLVTETSINEDVYLTSFEPAWSGGLGDTPYTIEFVEAREIMIREVGSSSGGTKSIQSLQPRPTEPQPVTYTVVPGDTLSGIAKKALGNSNRWQEIYDKNRSIIGPNPNVIYPGQVYTLP